MSYGIKVSKPGYDVKTATDPQLGFGSMFNTLRISQQGTGTLTDSTRTVTIAHNLGYVPAFMVHANFNNGGVYYISPLINTQPSFLPATNGEILAWADSTNLYVKAQSDVGKIRTYISGGNDLYGDYNNVTGNFSAGNESGSSADGAIRFPGLIVPKNSTVYYANIISYISYKGVGSGNMQFRCYGIAEDNTLNFSVNSPFGRSSTSSNVTGSLSLPSAGNTFSIGVDSIVNETVSRSGWVSGNAIGFKVFDNGSPTDVGFQNYNNFNRSYLEVMVSSTLADFKYTIFLNKII